MAFDYKKWLKEKEGRLENIPSLFEKGVEKYQRTIFDELVRLLDGLKRESGKIIFNAENLDNIAVVEKTIEELKEKLLSGDYIRSVDDFIKEFDFQADLNDTYFKNEFDFKKSIAADEVLNIAKKGAVEALVGEPLDSNFILPIKSILNDAVTSGASWVETVQNIRDFVEGNEDADGRLLRYAKGIARDEFSIADRSYNNAIADELEIEFFIWSGQKLTSSRCFCDARKGKYFHFKEIEAWGEGRDIGECDLGDGTWQGEREGTNAQTIFQYAGGWSCIDTIMGVSVFNVPKEDVQRAIDKGYYQPSEKELELLGL